MTYQSEMINRIQSIDSCQNCWIFLTVDAMHAFKTAKGQLLQLQEVKKDLKGLGLGLTGLKRST